MSDLQDYFNNNTGNLIHKWMHYFEIYDQWFRSYRGKPVVILEIGIYQGGSLRMWQEYFGEKAKIYAIDINPACKQFENENTKIFIGSQDDRDFLKEVRREIPKLDILIDDGGHSMNQQIVAFEELYNHIKNNGIYLCEDLHTSYWSNYGGGYQKKDTFIEYSKSFIDSINAWHAREKKLNISNFTKSTYSLHYYPSMLVIQKRLMSAPTSRKTGKILIPEEKFFLPDLKHNYFQRLWIKIIKNIRNQRKRGVRYIKKHFKS